MRIGAHHEDTAGSRVPGGGHAGCQYPGPRRTYPCSTAPRSMPRTSQLSRACHEQARLEPTVTKLYTTEQRHQIQRTTLRPTRRVTVPAYRTGSHPTSVAGFAPTESTVIGPPHDSNQPMGMPRLGA
eukprot:394592-Hanusia_phi.AAC.1